MQGPNLELAGNIGGIVRPAKVLIEYRGNAVSKVVPMPKFLKAITGDAKPTSRGPGQRPRHLDLQRLHRPAVRQVRRSARPAARSCACTTSPAAGTARTSTAPTTATTSKFADQATGACPAGTVAVPQLRITIAYNIPRNIQKKGQYQLDSFPEENHNPFSDHNDFVNVNSTQTMARITTCINAGTRCT